MGKIENSVNGKGMPETKEAVKTEVKTVDLITVKNLQTENLELKKNLDRVLKQLEAKPKSIDEQIAYFEQKKTKINHLRQFEATREKITEGLQVLKADQEKGLFTNDKYKLFFGKVNYNGSVGDEVFKISNTDLLIRFIEYFINEVNTKIAELEKEISL